MRTLRVQRTRAALAAVSSAVADPPKRESPALARLSAALAAEPVVPEAKEPVRPTEKAKPDRKRAVQHPWIIGMNEEQAAVIAHTDGPLFNPAQAGTGKTRALVNRVARLVHDGVPEDRILAVTFSKKAAQEMNTRLEQDLGIHDCRVGTWHSLAMQILKEDGHRASKWTVDEKDRHKYMVREAMSYRYHDWPRGDLSKVRRFIGICKAKLLSPSDEATLEYAKKEFGLVDGPIAVKVYKTSDELTHGNALLTFDDMLVFVAKHLMIEENAREWSSKWDHLLQDEAQDTNVVQMVIAKALAQYHRNYMVVGDPAQSIYGFRGSAPEHLMNFLEEWGATAVYMNKNYRSARSIVQVGNDVIRPALVRLPVDMQAMRDDEGSVRAVAAGNLDDEASLFVQWVQDHKQDGVSYSEIACLFRTNAQTRALEEALLSAKIPYVVMGGSSFYERKEIKDVLAYLRVASGRDPDGDAVKRCLNAPFRYLGNRFMDRVMDLARGRKDPSWSAIVADAARSSGIQRRQAYAADEWAEIINEITARIERDEKPGVILDWLVRTTKFIEWLEKDEGEESIENSHAANVREMVRVAGRFNTTKELLDYIEKSIAERLKQQKTQKGDRVLLMSIHRSKGLEWPCVWVVGCNADILPHAKGDFEEERRLFYVAVTRARDTLVCSWVRSMAAKQGIKVMYPSPFLRDAKLINDGESELPDEEDV